MHNPPSPPAPAGGLFSSFAGVSRGQWLTLAAALIGWAFDGFEMGVFPVVARPALRELLGTGVTEEAVRQWNGILSAAFLFGAAAGGWLFGWLGDRLGRVRAMAMSVLTYALLTGLCAFARSTYELTALRFLAALGMGGEWALGVALVMESWPASARPVLAGLIGAAGNLGYAVIAILSGTDLLKGQWRILFAVCAAPALLTFVLRLFVPESEKWRTAAKSGPRVRPIDVFAREHRRKAALGAAAGAVALLATWGAVQFTQLWAGKLSGDDTAGATVQLWSATAAACGALAAPILLHNVSRRWSYFLLCVLAFAATQVLFRANEAFDVRFLACVAITGVTTAAFYGWLPLYLPELFPTRVRAAGQGVCYNSGRILAACGVLATTFGFDVKGDYAKASATVCLIYLVGMALAWFLPETRGKPLPE